MQDKVRRCHRGNQAVIQRQAMSWPNEKVEQDKQWKTKHYTENYTMNDTN